MPCYLYSLKIAVIAIIFDYAILFLTMIFILHNDKISGEFMSPLDFMVMPFGHS